MNDIIVNNYSTLYNRLLTITLLPLSQAANLVAACLKIHKAMVNSTLANNIPPSLFQTSGHLAEATQIVTLVVECILLLWT